ncbi:MAG TPA: hypothetical protein VG917_00025 [Patescibacteria group bacterium]|nr:hypothetical protein [Patescibacteria group bacterium]
MNKIKTNFNKKNKIIFMILIPAVLILFWIVASMFLNNKISLSVLIYGKKNTDYIQVNTGKLLKGKTINGQFRAQDNYLGIVILRFNQFVKTDYDSEDVLLFKIREKGSKSWQFENTYKSGLLENNLLFPFGFPVFDQSRGKIYQFQIESLNGNNKNAVSIDKNNLTFLTGYKYPRSQILSSKKNTIEFFERKIITSFTSLDFFLSSFIYLLPLLFYVLVFLAYPILKKHKSTKNIFVAGLLLSILIDIVLLKEIYIGLWIFLIACWISCSIRYKLESKINFIIAFVLILIWVLLIQLNILDYQNKINIWVYTFMVIGLVMAVLDEKKSKK